MTVSKSRWFVGSSSSSRPGSTKRAHAMATRMRQPPDRSFTLPSIIFSVNCRPMRICRTRDSAASAPIASRSAPRMERRSQSFPSSSASASVLASIFSRRSASSVVSFARSTSAQSTSSTTLRSVAAASCCTRATVQEAGIGNLRVTRCLRSVVLPMPLGPRRP
mmetsp:Transcript_117311/g.252258  ORF Transcript_117311/g.252258 Transcript_117311/m.252258 type:complete len:164 (-) Transcript_117311:214-705(-)